jgi:hypothetical protein
MKGETMKRLQGILDNQHQSSVLLARLLLGGKQNEKTVDAEMKDMREQARDILTITNQCRGVPDPIKRRFIEDMRAQAVLVCALRSATDGTLPFVSKSVSSGYNEAAITHYGEMIASLDCIMAMVR